MLIQVLEIKQFKYQLRDKIRIYEPNFELKKLLREQQRDKEMKDSKGRKKDVEHSLRKPQNRPNRKEKT